MVWRTALVLSKGKEIKLYFLNCWYIKVILLQVSVGKEHRERPWVWMDARGRLVILEVDGSDWIGRVCSFRKN